MPSVDKLRNRILAEAGSLKRTFVFSCPDDVRVLQTARAFISSGVAGAIVLGEENNIKNLAVENDLNLSGVDIVSLRDKDLIRRYATAIHESLRYKGITFSEAAEMLASGPYFAAAMVKSGDATGLMGRTDTGPPKVITAVNQILGVGSNSNAIYSFSLAIPTNGSSPYPGTFIFNDGVVVAHPNSSQLAEMASLGAKLAGKIFKSEPTVGLLGFGIHSLAENPLRRSLAVAAEIIIQRDPLIRLEEIDFYRDVISALRLKTETPDVSPLRSPDVLIFPNKDAVTIARQSFARLSDYEYCGSFLIGAAYPAVLCGSDCTPQNALLAAAISSLF